ncbi:hypothetical protein KKA53_04970 [Candidatus Dependentiae bacterium]|nr:hypothetical protein [Candidatus Dependentiae bacterium]
MEYIDVNEIIPEIMAEIDAMAQQIADELMPRPESKYPNSKLLKLKDRLNGNKDKYRTGVQNEEIRTGNEAVSDVGSGTAI